MAMARVSCASALMLPKLIAPVTKRRTMDSSDSTSAERHRLGRRDQLEEPAERASAAGLVVGRGAELPEAPPSPRPGPPPGAGRRSRGSSGAARPAAATGRGRRWAAPGWRCGPKPRAWRSCGLALQLREPDAAEPRRGAGEVPVDERAVEAHRLEDLRAAVRLQRGDAHLGHHLEQPLLDRLDVAGLRLGLVELELARVRQRPHRVQREVGVHRRGAEAEERGEVVHLARLAGLHQEAGLHPDAVADEALVDRREREQRGDGRPPRVDAAIAEDDQAAALVHRLHRLLAEPLHRRLERALGRRRARTGPGGSWGGTCPRARLCRPAARAARW